VADPRKNRTGQLKLQTRLCIKSTVHGLRYECAKCKETEDLDRKIREEEEEEDEEEDEVAKLRHCHCPLWNPSNKLVASVTGGGAYRRFHKEQDEKKVSNQEKKVLDKQAREVDLKAEKNDLIRELALLQRKQKAEAEINSKKGEKKKSKVSQIIVIHD
jgi:hypothetical protein